MSHDDETAFGQMDAGAPPEFSDNQEIFADESSTISLVQEGMRVIDAMGEDIGEVAFVKMGDPEAATLATGTLSTPDVVDALADVLGGPEGEPRVPSPLREQLLRVGYLRIDGRGLFASTWYAAADAIASITSDAVILRVTKSELPEQH